MGDEPESGERAAGRAAPATLANGGSAAERWVFDFADGSREMRDLLGGKGANVAEMMRVLGADLIPAGFTITTAACVQYMRLGGSFPEGLAGAGGRRARAARATDRQTTRRRR